MPHVMRSNMKGREGVYIGLLCGILKIHKGAWSRTTSVAATENMKPAMYQPAIIAFDHVSVSICMFVYGFLHLQHKCPLEGSRSAFSRAPDGRLVLRTAHCFLVFAVLSDLSTFATFSIFSSLKSLTNMYLLR